MNPPLLPLTAKPGRRERHLCRRHRNPLFAWPPILIEPQSLLASQKADHEEMESFRDALDAIMHKAVDLPPDAGSDLVLGLAEELERLYEQACGLPEGHEPAKEALARLIALIMKAVRKAAGNDSLARQELDDEEQARAIHFGLLEQPLVADILHPESPIAPDELVPVLLGAGEQELEAMLDVFDPDQLAMLVTQGGELLDDLDRKQVSTAIPRQRFARIEKELAARLRESLT